MEIGQSIIQAGNQQALSLLLKAKAQLKIGFLGGSITRGTGAEATGDSYVNLFKKWVATINPTATVVNAGIGGTDSEYGLLRLTRDLGEQLPDIVVLEFSVNDKRPVNAVTYEALIQKLLLQGTLPIVLENFRFFSGESFAATHTQVAKRYNLPILSMKAIFNGGELADMPLMHSLSQDGLHPNDAGHQLIFEVLKNFFSASLPFNEVANWRLKAANSLTLGAAAQPKEYGDYKFTRGIEIATVGPVFTWQGKTKKFGLQYKRTKGVNSLCLEVIVTTNEKEEVYEVWLDNSDSRGDLLVISELWNNFQVADIHVTCRAKLKGATATVSPLYLTGIITSEV